MRGKAKTLILTAILGLTALLGACRDELAVSTAETQGSPYEEALQAAQAYYAGLAPSLSTRMDTGSELEPIEIAPAWEESFLQQAGQLKVLETASQPIGLSFRFYLPEAELAYAETGDSRYLQSYTRFVFRTDARTGKMLMFYMTVLPAPEFVEATDFLPFADMSYLHRDGNFSGVIMFHNEDGSYSNGWLYDKGKVRKKIIIVEGETNFETISQENTRTSTTAVYGSYTTCRYTETAEMMVPGGLAGATMKRTSFTTRSLGVECEVTGYTTYIYSDVEDNDCSTDDEYLAGGGAYTGAAGTYTGAKTDSSMSWWNTNPLPLTTPKAPCGNIASLKENTEFNKRLIQIRNKTLAASNTSHYEYGWLRLSDNTYQDGIPQNNRISYNSLPKGSKVAERCHAHPAGGGALLSLADWKAVAAMVKADQIDTYSFVYAICSDVGLMAMTVDDLSALKTFLTDTSKSDMARWIAANDEKSQWKYSEAVGIGGDNIEKDPAKQRAIFQQFLTVNNAGLQLYYCTDDYSVTDIPWQAVQMSSSKVLNWVKC